MEEKFPAGPTPQRVLEESRNSLHVVQAGTVGEGLCQVTPQRMKVEPEEYWEARWQEFLKAMETPHLAWGATQPSRVKASLTFSEVCQGLGGKGVSRLQPAVTVGDQVASGLLKPGEHVDCPKVKEEIPGDGTTLATDIQLQHFRSFCYQEAEGPRGACSRLQELCYGWLKPERHTKEQILELVILEQFLTILPSKIQSRVRERRPETCSQAVALAEDFLHRERESKGEEKQILKPEGFAPCFSKAQQTPLDPGDVCRVVKQESNGDPDVLGGGDKPANEPRPDPQGMPLEQGGRKVDEDICADQHGPEREWKTVSARDNPGSFLCRNAIPDKLQKGMKWNKCPVCRKGFTRKSSLMRHQIIHSGEKPYQCPDCGKRFNQKTNLISHRGIHAEENLYACSDCGGAFRPHWGLNVYQRGAAGGKLYKCPACQKSLTQRGSAIRHRLLNEHRIETRWVPTGEPEQEKEDGASGCRDGPERQVESATLRWKNKSVIDPAEDLFKTTAPQRLHKEVMCPVCGKSFTRKSSVGRHQRIHTGEKPYQCSDCGKSFNQKANLTNHKRTHTEDKPFRCSDCGKSFRHKRSFLVHQVVHSGEAV